MPRYAPGSTERKEKHNIRLSLLRLLQQNATDGEAYTVGIYLSQFWRRRPKVKVLIARSLVEALFLIADSHLSAVRSHGGERPTLFCLLVRVLIPRMGVQTHGPITSQRPQDSHVGD